MRTLRFLVVGALAACSPERPSGMGAPPFVPTASIAQAPAPAPQPPSEVTLPTDPRAETLVLVAGGDVNLGRYAGQLILANPDYDPLHHLAPLLSTGDLRFVNLESPLSDQSGETQSPHHKLVFTGPPGGADVLRRARIDVVSLANNHPWDYGERGFLQTLDNLERVGIPYAGARRAPDTQYEPTVLRVRGWSIALFAVTHIWNYGSYQRHPGRKHVAWASPEALAEPVARALREHDLVLVSYHGGVEYVPVPFGPIRKVVDAIMALGPHALLGHHPHVPRGVEWYGGRPALYSLGNLVFGRRSDKRWERAGFVARLTFQRSGELSIEACPYHLRGHTPIPFEEKHRAIYEREFRGHLQRISEPLGGVEIGEAGEHSCMPVRSR